MERDFLFHICEQRATGVVDLVYCIHLRHAGYPRGLLGFLYERESSKWSSFPARRYPILTEFVRPRLRIPRVPRCSSSTIVHYCGERLTGRASFTSNSVYPYLYLYPTLTPQQSERAATVYMYIPTSSSLSLSPIIAAKQLCQAASGGMFPYSREETP